MAESHAQHLATTAWAVEAAAQSDARPIVMGIGDFAAQDVANTVWAFTTVSQLDKKLITVLASAAERSPNIFNEQGLANMA